MKIEYKIIKNNLLNFVGFANHKRMYEHIEDAKIVINGEEYVIPKGYKIDGWSIPPVLDMFFDLVRDPVPAAWHDWFYDQAGMYPKITRKVADTLLRQIALDRGCQKREVFFAYYTVRICSNFIWNKYQKRNLKK